MWGRVFYLPRCRLRFWSSLGKEAIYLCKHITFCFLQFSVNGERMEANKVLLIFETLKKKRKPSNENISPFIFVVTYYEEFINAHFTLLSEHWYKAPALVFWKSSHAKNSIGWYNCALCNLEFLIIESSHVPSRKTSRLVLFGHQGDTHMGRMTVKICKTL